METKREPVVVVMSILAGLTAVVSGAAGIAEMQGMGWLVPWIALGGLLVAGATTGVQFWVRGQVTPVEDAQPLARHAVDPDTFAAGEGLAAD